MRLRAMPVAIPADLFHDRGHWFMPAAHQLCESADAFDADLLRQRGELQVNLPVGLRELSRFALFNERSQACIIFWLKAPARGFDQLFVRENGFFPIGQAVFEEIEIPGGQALHALKQAIDSRLRHGLIFRTTVGMGIGGFDEPNLL